MSALLAFAFGASLGWVQVRALSQKARDAGQGQPLLLRLLWVGGALTMAARSGCLLPAACGWALSYALSVLVLIWRWE